MAVILSYTEIEQILRTIDLRRIIDDIAEGLSLTRSAAPSYRRWQS